MSSSESPTGAALAKRTRRLPSPRRVRTTPLSVRIQRGIDEGWHYIPGDWAREVAALEAAHPSMEEAEALAKEMRIDSKKLKDAGSMNWQLLRYYADKWLELLKHLPEAQSKFHDDGKFA